VIVSSDPVVLLAWFLIAFVTSVGWHLAARLLGKL
jgi:hypothetical protein